MKKTAAQEIGAAGSKYIFFYGHRKNKTGVTSSCFSQFYDCEFKVDGVKYCCAEQFMMASKARTFRDSIREKKIMGSKEPAKIKELGRRVTPFDGEMWETVAFNVVARGNFYKFSQNEALKRFLLATGEKILVEASPSDTIWGIGLSAKDEGIEDEKNWRGQNLLGKALMEVRKALRENVGEVQFMNAHPIMNRRIVEWEKSLAAKSQDERVSDPTQDPEVNTGTAAKGSQIIAEKGYANRLQQAKQKPGKKVEDEAQSTEEQRLLAAFDKAYRGHVYRNLLRDVKKGGRYGFKKKCTEYGGVKVYEPVRGKLKGSEIFAALWAKLMGIRYIEPVESNETKKRRQAAAQSKGVAAQQSVLKPAFVNFDFTKENVGRGAFRTYLDSLTWSVYCELCGADSIKEMVKEKDIYGKEIVNIEKGKKKYQWVPKYVTAETDFALQKEISHALSNANEDKRRGARCKLMLETSMISYYLISAKGVKCPDWFKLAIKKIFEENVPADNVKEVMLAKKLAPSSSAFDKELSVFRKKVRKQSEALLAKAFAYDVVEVTGGKKGQVRMLSPREVLNLAWDELALWVGDARAHDIRYNIIRGMVDTFTNN